MKNKHRLQKIRLLWYIYKYATLKEIRNTFYDILMIMEDKK